MPPQRLNSNLVKLHRSYPMVTLQSGNLCALCGTCETLVSRRVRKTSLLPSCPGSTSGSDGPPDR